MSKAKIKERFGNAVNAFFDDEKLCNNTSLISPNDSSKFNFDETESFADKYKNPIKLLKQIFLFLPGAFLSFFMSVAFTGFIILRPSMGGENHLYLAIFITIASAFMTFLGLGDWRNPKHLVIPISIIGLSIILGVVGSITHGVDNFPQFIDHYAANFLPLAFILPFLAKGWVDKMDSEN